MFSSKRIAAKSDELQKGEESRRLLSVHLNCLEFFDCPFSRGSLLEIRPCSDTQYPCSPGRRADQFWALSGHLEKRRGAPSPGISTAKGGVSESARRARITTALQTGICRKF